MNARVYEIKKWKNELKKKNEILLWALFSLESAFSIVNKNLFLYCFIYAAYKQANNNVLIIK